VRSDIRLFALDGDESSRISLRPAQPVCLIWGCVIWLLVTFAKADPIARSRSFYDGRGSFAGSSVTRGNSSSFYDGRGSFADSSVRHGKWESFYDGRGRYGGSVINTSPRR
jgi:hypothetical protein